MPPTRLVPLKLRRDATGGLRVSGTPDRSPVLARVETLLAQVNRRADAPGPRPVDVQVVVAVSDPAGYQRWRTDRQATWRAQGGRYTTATWPRTLGPDSLAAVLLPLPHGASAGDGRTDPRLVADPLFSSRSLTDGSGPEDLALALIAEWLRQAAAGPALRLAPPVLEFGTERRILGAELPWPLA